MIKEGTIFTNFFLEMIESNWKGWHTNLPIYKFETRYSVIIYEG